jgi:hypothetical protein
VAVPTATATVAALLHYSLVCISELELILILKLAFHFMDVLCIVLCTLVDMWITTGADSDTARFWCKYPHKYSEKCIEEREILIWDPNIILLSNISLFIPVKTNINLHYI